jgi:hypothetical protein
MADDDVKGQAAQKPATAPQDATTPAPAPAASAVDRKAVADLPALGDLKIQRLTNEVLSPQQIEEANRETENVNWLDPMAVSKLGEKDQSTVSTVARNIMDSTRIADAGAVGTTVAQFQAKLREIGIGDLKESQLTKLIRTFVPGASAAEQWFNRLKHMGPELESILTNADKECFVILESWKVAGQVGGDCDKINDRLKIWIKTAQNGVDRLEAMVAELEAKKKASADPELAQKYDEALTAREFAQRRLADLWQTRTIVLKARGELGIEKKGLLFQYVMMKSSLKLYEIIFYTQGTAALLAEKMEKTNKLLKTMQSFGGELVTVGADGLSNAMTSLDEMRAQGTINPDALRRGVEQFLEVYDREVAVLPKINDSLKAVQATAKQLVEQIEKRQPAGGQTR